jgi:uncharacterized protein (UPF0276 family)
MSTLDAPATAAASVGIGWRHPHYAQLLQERPALDFLEVHSENFFADGGAAISVLEQGRAHYPVSLHGVGLSLGAAAGLDPWHLDQLAALARRIDPIRISDHASFARGRFQGVTVHASDLLPLPFTAEALQVLCANVQQVQDRLQRRFMVENLSAYVQWRAPADEAMWAEADFLAELSRRTGCQLLVDVNNIYVNALNAQARGELTDPMQTCTQWLDAIPRTCVGEMHLAGHRRVSDAHGEIVIDDHGSQVCHSVWVLYRHAVDCYGRVPTLIEWDTEIPELSVLLEEAQRARSILLPSAEMAAA